MKKIFSIAALLVVTGTVFSQISPIVTVNITGNRNKQITIDNKYYAVNNASTDAEQSIVINDLALGQHTLKLTRNNQYNSKNTTTAYFTIRSGYDLTITINSDGAVSTSESRMGGQWGSHDVRALSTTAFNKLYSQAKAKTSSSARTNFLENEFTNTNKGFTSSQARQLIALVNSESMRLKLIKQVYSRITDRENFSTVANLLNSSANRAEVNNYIASLNYDNNTGDINTPMTDQRFKTIYNEVYAETANGNRNYYLANFFNRGDNYYSSLQASQLIQLVQGEQERFNLAKEAYRGITDRENYSVVYQLLSNSSNRSALMAYVNTYDNNLRMPMSEADFNKLYQSVYYQNSAARYTAIYAAFTTAGNYFSVAQAKKLIPLVNTESDRLVLAKAAYRVLVDQSNYIQFNEFLTSSSSRTDFYNYIANYNNAPANTGFAMSEAAYNKIYQEVAASWSSSTRINLVNQAFNNSNNYFNVDQVRRLLLLVSSESERLTLAKNGYDNTVDPQNYSLLYNLFTSSVYKNDLADYIANNGGTPIHSVAMSESEFNNMYTEVQWTFGFGAKMNALTDIFNKETNYFTVQQAKELVQLVSNEDNRLELAKSAYNNIVDPENFNLMYDVLSSQSAKNDLAAYVNSNAYIR